jgi:hypothetical protein
VKFGIGYFPTDEGIDPATLARMCEERLFESLFFTDHTHIPASRDTDYPAGGELPREYSRIYDPFVALMAAAAATERLMVGTGVCLVIERDPIVTAKQAASVDRLSGGRLLFGVGAGWNAEEMRNHGTDPARRFGVMRERVEAIKEIWTSDETEYHGRYVDFEPIRCWPKPVCRATPADPCRRPRKARVGPRPRVRRRVDAEPVRRRREDQGANRAPAAQRHPDHARATADPAILRPYEEAGVHRAVFWVRPGDVGDLGRRLDHRAAEIEAYGRG